MIGKYLQQSFEILKQTPLFSALYMLGTGMAIALVMVLAVLYYLKVGDIYPEKHRSRMMVALSAHMQERGDASSNTTYCYALPFVKECFYSLEDVEAVTAVTKVKSALVKSDMTKRPLSVMQKLTDTAFWKVFDFTFTAGGPFAEADFQSGIPVAVVSEGFARRAFGRTDVVGSEVNLNHRKYRICGVVKSPSYAMKLSFADVWTPYTCDANALESNYLNVLGAFQVAILLHSAGDAGRVKKCVDEYVHKFNMQQHDGYQLLLHGQPYIHWKTLFYQNDMEELDFAKILREMGVWLLLLLLVPALNLSGMIASRMERRLPEMGVRKAFGATCGKLFSQIVWENLLLTALGGVLGLLLSFGMLFLAQEWLLTMLDGGTILLPGEVQGITWDMLFNPYVFMLAFFICVVLNLISALVPAYLSLKKNIVYSLNKQK
ncbi:ABC transporter permease [Phocaeicola sp.]|uniref:ABC transporter permease n=1 Tax=Phocaeicola sp. TaxID=2773926 RepID=UPI0023CF4164|nr:ABC transporter permease [Phocaeicola sp.]MDE5676920.1 ABC transporter permease [Phocaeicola sp.]